MKSFSRKKNEETFNHIKEMNMIIDDTIITAEISEQRDQILPQGIETACVKMLNK